MGGVKPSHRTKKQLGGYSGEDPPLPIPNREVKLTCADGTATPCGRVGSRRLQTEACQQKLAGFFRLKAPALPPLILLGGSAP